MLDRSITESKKQWVVFVLRAIFPQTKYDRKSYMIFPKSFFVLALCGLLQACVAPPPAPTPSKPDPASVALEDALKSPPPRVPVGPEVAVPGPVYGPKTTVSFLGDARTLLANAAKGRGADWTFESTGPQPHLPIYVQISVKDVSFADFLRNIAAQLGQRGDIELKDKSIKLRYRANL